jgi:hypothetical protein
MDDNTIKVTSWKDFEKGGKSRKMMIAGHCGMNDCEDLIKSKTNGISSRLIRFGQSKISGKCIHCGKASKYEVYFSKSY